MKKFILSVCLLAAASAALAQTTAKAPEPGKTYRLNNALVPAYKSLADTLNAARFIPRSESIKVVGVQPNWYTIRTGSAEYFIPARFVDAQSAAAPAPPAPVMGTAPRTEEYCLLVAAQKFLSTKVYISLDYGQATSLFSQNQKLLKTTDGELQTFNSVVDALNYMNSYGWQFVNAYVITVGNQNVYHYMLRRPLAKP